MPIGFCPECGEEFQVKYTPSPKYYDIRIGVQGFIETDENDFSSVEVVCPYDEGGEDHKPDPEWENTVIQQFHRQVLGGELND